LQKGTYGNNLRRSIVGRTTTCLEHSLTSFPSGHTEIGYFDVLVLVKKQVLWLQISVTDVESMTVVNGVNDLLEVM
jgi:hypothetical protein